MVFHITFMLVLSHDKKCCNFINLFPSILWDLIVIGLVLSWWKSDQDSQRSHEEHMSEAEESMSFVTHLTNCQLMRWPAKCTDIWDFKCDSYTLHSYYIYHRFPQNYKETIQKKTLERFLQHTYHVRESYTFSREKSLVSSPLLSHCYTVERRFVPKHNPYLFIM